MSEKRPTGATETATCRQSPHPIYLVGDAWVDAVGSPRCHGAITHLPMPAGLDGAPQAIGRRGGNRR